MNLNGCAVHSRKAKDGTTTLFIVLPRAAWRDIGGTPCRCPTCVARKGAASYWDTLAVAEGSLHAWTVHYPELHS